MTGDKIMIHLIHSTWNTMTIGSWNKMHQNNVPIKNKNRVGSHILMTTVIMEEKNPRNNDAAVWIMCSVSSHTK